MSDEGYKALSIIIPSFFGLLTTVLVLRNDRSSKNRGTKQAAEIEKVHKLINSGLTVRIEEAKEAGVKTGIILEKERQENKPDENKK